ncbi:hypothetical protein MN210_00765 [Psychrobacter raelei]|uniref:Uncharacterized protein n=1 Tax=Psychrobacter raelei TaxID=2565531 RepID=A0AAT9PFM8_9GAMM|nr:hypothetical protein [Psychrobacter sp. PraFG1]UNK05499.1 hypothetical protein MN210_00765 [Psychrobacter sp. PraFG1]
MAIIHPINASHKHKLSRKSRSSISGAKLCLLALLGVSQLGVAASIKPLHFEKGAVSSKVSGILAAKQQDTWYQFKAQKGQFALINITPLKGTAETANVGVLHMPSGQQDGSKGGIVYQNCLPETGTYKLRIARNLMATQGGKAGYQAEVIILPTYASQDLCQ